ncbi:MAG: hypothetical protein U0531_22575 [Dehalococcoidia bacterium]
MPLFKIETRTKTDAPPAPPAARAPRRAAERPGAERAGAGVMPIVAGASLALLLLAGVGAMLLRRQGVGQTVAPAGGAAAQPGAAQGNPPPAAASLATVPPLTALAALPPINADFARNAMVANVGGKPFLMADLELAVRVARTIASLSADPVPEYDDVAGMKAFQVKLLRRQIDAMLFEAAARTMTGKPPPLTSDELINSLLSRQNAARKQLDDAMAANGVAEANIVAFLQRAGDIDAYIQAELMKDLSADERQDPARRDALVRDWLDKAWAQQNVQIYFYDPDTVLPAEDRGGATPGGAP